MNYLPTRTSRLVVQHPCQVSLKSMQGCRRSWEDKLKCVKILSVKDHNSAKICRTWIISPHALLDLWCNIPAKFHSNPCKDVGGVEKTNFDVTEWRKDGQSKHLRGCPWKNQANSKKSGKVNFPEFHYFCLKLLTCHQKQILWSQKFNIFCVSDFTRPILFVQI